jgi:CheY-like chemotaxis protein
VARILLVDDDEDVLRGMRRVLQRLGHEVVAAADGHQALRALEGDPCDLVITDINMPEMDGIELILALRERWPKVPIIAISGGGLMPKELLLASAEVLGAVTTLPKPVGVAELEAAVARALGAAADREGRSEP